MERLQRNRAADGLRTLAFLGVSAYHLQVAALPAAHLAVQIFFVLAGYFSLRQSNLRNTGKSRSQELLDLPAALARRLLRLYRPLLFCLALLVLWTRFCQPDVFLNLVPALPSALGAYQHLYEALSDHSYFAAALSLDPTVHIWALSLETVFYLLFPLFLLSVRRYRKSLLAVLAVGGSLFLALAALLNFATPELLVRLGDDSWLQSLKALFGARAAYDASPLYYSALGRLSAFALGALSGQYYDEHSRHSRQRADAERIPFLRLRSALLFVLVLGAMAWPPLAFDRLFLYLLGLPLYALLVAALLYNLDRLNAAEASKVHRSPLLRLLGSAPCEWIAQRSYSYYLWQFPLQILLRQGLASYSLSLPLSLLLQLLALLLLGELSYRLTELPFPWKRERRQAAQAPSKARRQTQHKLYQWGSAALALLIILPVAYLLPKPTAAAEVLDESEIIAKIERLQKEQAARQAAERQAAAQSTPQPGDSTTGAASTPSATTAANASTTQASQQGSSTASSGKDSSTSAPSCNSKATSSQSTPAASQSTPAGTANSAQTPNLDELRRLHSDWERPAPAPVVGIDKALKQIAQLRSPANLPLFYKLYDVQLDDPQAAIRAARQAAAAKAAADKAAKEKAEKEKAAAAAKAKAEAEAKAKAAAELAAKRAAIPASLPDFGLNADQKAILAKYSYTMIGDSVLAMTADLLYGVMPKLYVDAQVSRQFSDGVGLVQALANNGQLGDVVIIALGTNGDASTASMQAIRNICGDRPLFFVNLSVPRDYEAANNAAIANFVANTPNCYLIDWHAASKTHREYFYQDGYHPIPQAAHIYDELVINALLSVLN